MTVSTPGPGSARREARTGSLALPAAIGFTIVASIVVSAVLVAGDHGELRLTAALVILAGFALVGELFPIRFTGHEGELAISSAFLLAVLVIAGPVAVLLVQAVATVASELLRRKPLHRLAYNAAQLVLCWAAAGTVWKALRPPDASPLTSAGLAATAAAALAFFICNLALGRLPVALASRRSLVGTLRANLAFELWTTLILFSLSPVVIVVALDLPLLLPVLALPVLAIQRGSHAAVVNEFLATHDALTGLANRAFLSARVEAALADGAEVAVLLIDLGQFKEINDTLGHQGGDDVLCAVGSRLAGAVPARATVARLGGDEFAVAIKDPGGLAGAKALAATLLAALDAPFEIGALNLRVGPSAGIACAPEHGDAAALLLQRADIALQVAKAQHRQSAEYTPEHDTFSPLRLQLASELRVALANDELELHYQPLITLADGRLDRVEALIRWRHPERGLVPPDQFVPLAERTGLIRELTTFALGEALGQVRRWRDEGVRTRVSVNLSAHNLDDEQLPHVISALLERHRLAPDALELELTESMIMADPERAGRILGELRAMGLELAVDDFGTGYSSLAYLRRLPVTCLKIDRAFVGNMDVDEGNATIVSAIVELAHTLGLEVTAEGVERPEVRDQLRDLGVQRAQGYLFSRPLPPAELANWARAVADAEIGTATIAPPTPGGTPARRAGRTRSTGR